MREGTPALTVLVRPVPLIVGILLAPESPWWHIRHGRKDEAKQSMRRLARKNGFTQREIDANLACECGRGLPSTSSDCSVMVYTNEIEKQVSVGTSYLDCFRGADLRRTEIVCMVWVSQVLCRVIQGPYFFQQAGISANASFKLGWASTAMGFLGTTVSWFIMHRVGRRPLLLFGMLAMTVAHL